MVSIAPPANPITKENAIEIIATTDLGMASPFHAIRPFFVLCSTTFTLTNIN
jgi:hypothetical protein